MQKKRSIKDIPGDFMQCLRLAGGQATMTGKNPKELIYVLEITI